MSWELDSKRSIYAQLMEQLGRRIVNGYYAPGGRVESVRELAEQAGVNPNTMQRALSEMERLGVLYSSRTSGRFVTEDEEKINMLKQEMAKNAVGEFIKAIRDLSLSEEEIFSLIRSELREEE